MKSALIQFSVENFRSFRDRVTFSMETIHPSTKVDDKYCHYFSVGKKSHNIYVAKNSFIFGPNASGKSNLLSAIQYMDMKVESSHDASKKEDMRQDYFRLNQTNKNIPSFFEMIMEIDTEIFQYNFEILGEEIISENLYWIGVDKETEPKQLLKRGGGIFELGNALGNMLNNDNARDIKDRKTDSTTLFISAAQNWKEPTAQKIAGFFRESLRTMDMGKGSTYTKKRIKDDNLFKKKVLQYISKGDFSICDIDVIETNPPQELIEKYPTLQGKKGLDMSVAHKVFDDKGNHIDTVSFEENDESDGTRNFLKILGPILDTLDNGRILLVDEFNTSLHPLLCEFIIDISLDTEINKSNAQFIFATHDISILDNKKLNKDQFWFTERDKYGASSLYSLDDFDIRNDDKNYQTKYRNGRFGAVPFIPN